MNGESLVPDELLAILRCPETHSPLQRAEGALIERLSQSQSAATLTNRIGESISRPLRGGLVNESRTLLYPIYEHGVTLVADEAIRLDNNSIDGAGAPRE